MYTGRCSLLLGTALVASAACVPDWSRLDAHLTNFSTWAREGGVDVVAGELTAVALWIVLVWLAIGLLLTLIGQLPGVAGRLAAATARRVLPSVLTRLLAGAAGVGVLVGPVFADARAVVGPTLGAPPAVSTTGDPRPAPFWPVNDAPHPHPHPQPSVGWPISTATATVAAPTADSGAVDRPERTGHSAVTVRPGDSLWAIAARRLPPRAGPGVITEVWPRWYAANRGTIGADPDLIRPGQLLQPPRSAG